MNKKNLVQCVNGHYYDADQFAECPHCGGQTMGTDTYDSEATVSFEENPMAEIDDKKTEPLTIPKTEDVEMTVGIGKYFEGKARHNRI